MKKIILLINCFLVIVLIANSQTAEFPILKGTYLGQKPPGLTPEIFAPGIVSTEKAWEAAISFSPDGKYFFFHRNNDIWWVSAKIIEELRPGE